MTIQDAIQNLDNLRRAVLTVAGQNGPTALTGAEHDVLRQAVDVLRIEHPAQPAPAPEPKKD